MKRKPHRRCIGKWPVYLLAVLAICMTSKMVIAAEDLAPPAAESAGPDDRAAYRIGAGDVLEILTWKEPDFSKDVLVRLDGKISFPLLDDVTAAGLTPAELKKILEEKASAFIEAPVVTVSVKNPASKKFYILGEIARTGEYPLIKDLTVLQAFALAGGFTEWASKKEILLLRRQEGQEKVYRINYKAIVEDQDFSTNLKVRADDTIVVP